MVGDHQAGRLADALADPADGEQQDCRGDRDEDVVETRDQPELLFVGNARGPLALDMSALCVRGFGGDHAGGNRVVQLLLRVHAILLLFGSE
jgi:hypothetical protein